MKILARNRRARFDYEIHKTLIAGVVLRGGEVKSAKSGHISLTGSYVMLRGNEAYLASARISPYQPAADSPTDPERDRKLLLRKQEITKLIADKQNGLSVVPLAAGLTRGLVKIEIGIGRGRKVRDKRHLIQEREAARDAKSAKI